jgi:hypothetical protein
MRQKYNAYWNSNEVYKREGNGITRYRHNMASITGKIDQVDNIPADAFPCVITFRNELISDISDNFIEKTVCEYNPYVDEGIIAVTDASVIGERGTWAAVVTTKKEKNCSGTREPFLVRISAAIEQNCMGAKEHFFY